jgi:hypothetical protein
VRRRKGKLALILVKGLQAVRIASKEEWDELLAGDMAIRIVGSPYQVLDRSPMPIWSLANLLFGTGVPMISPSNDPSRDFTIRAPGADGDGESDVSLAEGAIESACCWDAQPNNKETKIAVGSSIFARISSSIAEPAVNVIDCASIS